MNDHSILKRFLHWIPNFSQSEETRCPLASPLTPSVLTRRVLLSLPIASVSRMQLYHPSPLHWADSEGDRVTKSVLSEGVVVNLEGTIGLNR